jgi:CheY-like chemotaxis protein
MERLNLPAMVREMAELVQPSISKKVSLHLDLARNVPSIEADRGQVQQVFTNLVLNAAEAIGGHAGVVTVRAGVQPMDEAFRRANPEAADHPAGTYVFLEVHDTGCGMDDDTRSRIFDPFFSTKFTGRGLGLAAVAGIVRGHKGAIMVRSAPGKGSTFTVLFPAVAGPAEQRPCAGVILLVDDEPMAREMVKRALERHGYTVMAAESGPSAIDLLKTHGGEIGIVILDLSKPHMSGEEVLPELRKIRPDIKILISSGHSEDETRKAFRNLRVTGFVQKPYTAKGIAEQVRLALESAGGQGVGK